MKEPKFYENSQLPVWLSKITPIEIWAITLGGFVFCRGVLSEQVKRHETIHFRQYQETLYVGFVLIYLLDFLWAAIIKRKGFTRESYLSIRFEQEAHGCDSYDDYLATRPAYAWLKYPIGGDHQ